MATPTREEMEQALLIKRLTVICLSKRIRPDTYEVRQVGNKLFLLQNGKAVVMGDPVTRLCYTV